MMVLVSSVAILLVFCLMNLINAFLLNFNICVILSGAIICFVTRLSSTFLIVFLLVCGGLFLDALTFNYRFGDSVFIYLIFYVFYPLLEAKLTSVPRQTSIILAQLCNVTFILYEYIMHHVSFYTKDFLATLIFSQVIVYFFDKVFVSICALVESKKERNPFNITQNIFKNNDF